MFQSTPPYGGRLSPTAIPPVRRCFNPRPRMGGDGIVAFLFIAAMFQSTPPYGGRRLSVQLLILGRIVSIHAPVWGATCHGGQNQCQQQVSIHAPVWGATIQECLAFGDDSFNPRPRMGGDCSTCN